jgi:predicted amidohydrolase
MTTEAAPRVLTVLAAVAALCLAGPSPGQEPATERKPAGRLRLATCQFPISADIAANARVIRDQIREARGRGADLVQFAETALSGYAKQDHATLDDLDWPLLDRETRSIAELARECGTWVVLGSTHRLSGDHKPHNSLYVIGPDGRIVDRYDKRFCTTTDLRFYSPGDRAVTFDVNGVTCGLAICHDFRYPELYRDYARRGVRLMLHSFYNTEPTDEAIRRELAPEYAQVYASMNNFFVSYTNTTRRWAWTACFVTPDGQIAATLPQHESGVMVNDVDVDAEFEDSSRAFRAAALRGVLHSGELVDDPRSRDRTRD